MLTPGDIPTAPVLITVKACSKCIELPANAAKFEQVPIDTEIITPEAGSKRPPSTVAGEENTF